MVCRWIISRCPLQATVHSRRAEVGLTLCSLPFTVEAGAEHPFKRQFHTTHVGADGWELHGMRWEGGSGLTADRCARKFDEA